MSLPAFLDGIAVHWLWLSAAALLAILEIFLPGIFLVWIAAAAALVGVVLAVVDLSFPFQVGLFAVLAFLAVWAGRIWYARNPVTSADPP